MPCVITVTQVEGSPAVVQQCEPIDSTDGILGGVVCTGFIDVEKTISIACTEPTFERHIFLEKKLPFQIVILDLNTNPPGNGTPGVAHSHKK